MNSLTARQPVRRTFFKPPFSQFLSCGIIGAMLATVSLRPARAHAATVNLPWDWSGVIGTGQSLAVGDHGTPVKSTNQPFGNLKLTTGNLHWPMDPNDPALALVPLVEPVGRIAPRYPSSWPENIAGETPHAAMANQVSALVKAASGRDFIGVHGEVGENGQGIEFLKKNPVPRGTNGHSFEAALIETKAITRLAKAAGKTYGVGAIIVTHGEHDAGDVNYESELFQLWSDYNNDLPAITGQKQPVQMIVSQQNSQNDHSPATQAEWKIGADHSAAIVCSGPKYQYPSAEGTHLTTDGYQQLGEKYGQIYFERVVLGHNWQPLQPTAIERNGPVLTVHFYAPVGPLVWETNFSAPHQSIAEWKDAKGFEVTAAGNARVAISSVAISGNAVVLTCATDPGPNARVSYAMVAERPRMQTPYRTTFRWGLLRDSDPFVGDVTKKAQPNYCVAFDLTTP